MIWALPLKRRAGLMTCSPASALFGSTVMEEARQRDGSAACSARTLISGSIRRSMMRALRQDGAIRAALAGVACPWRYRLISRQLC